MSSSTNRRTESATRNKQRDKERETKNSKRLIKEEDVDDIYVTQQLLAKKLKTLSVVCPNPQPVVETTTTEQQQQDPSTATSTTTTTETITKKKKQNPKIKAIVKPGGKFLALNPENVMIDNKCTVGRVLRVITNKLKEQSEALKKTRSDKDSETVGWFSSMFGYGNSHPRLISPADSIFLKINDVFMPKHDLLITSLMNSPDEEVKIFYYVEETFG